jgi:hypothetical protein
MDPPLVDQILPFFNPKNRDLSDEETNSAITKNLVSFPEVIRSLNDPQLEDTYVLLSFLVSSPHNYVKVRGYGNLESCKKKAKQIVQSVDSRLPIAIARLGQWCYVTSDPIQVSKEKIKLIDDKEVTHKDHVNTLISEHEKNQQANISEQPKVTNELKEDLNSYIREKVMMYETYKQIQFLTKKIELLEERQSLIRAINSEYFDEYEESWYREYLTQISKIGIKETNITIDMMKEIEGSIKKVEGSDLRKRLDEVENKYNNLKYSSVDF